MYLDKGFGDAKVELQEGDKPGDKGVVFSIYEANSNGSSTRSSSAIRSSRTLGYGPRSSPSPASSGYSRAKSTGSRSKGIANGWSPTIAAWAISRCAWGAIWIQRLGNWLTLTYVIDEGPRYQIRNITLVGNDTFTTPSLMDRLELTSGQFFDSRKMNRDLAELRDTYGSQGYIHADIKADPQFLEEPGMIDLVYDIQEGDQYRVGKITVNIEGENPHTRRNSSSTGCRWHPTTLSISARSVPANDG